MLCKKFSRSCLALKKKTKKKSNFIDYKISKLQQTFEQHFEAKLSFFLMLM